MPKTKVCPTPGCPVIIPRTADRCPTHAADYERARGTRTERGYGADHVRLRRQWERQGVVGLICPRCHQPILTGQQWDLDHTDDRRGYNGPAHASCNRATAKKAPPLGG